MSKAAELANLIGNINAGGGGVNRNLLINSAMTVSQRGTSQAFAHDATTNAYLIDRWRFVINNTDELDGTYAQVDDDPLGGDGKAFKWTTGTAESAIASDEYGYFTQKIEAQNLQHIQNGNSNAKSLTLSFYVKSSITGTFSVGLYKPDNTARQQNKTYTINSANTWEKKSVTFAGDTSGGGINNDNGEGIWVSWNLFAGSDFKGGGSTSGWVNYANNTWADGLATDAVMTTAGATWLITQCQLEIGQNPTEFEHEPIERTLAKCQRYFQIWTQEASGFSTNNYAPVADSVMHGDVYAFMQYTHPVQLRATPALTFNGNFASNNSGADRALSSLQINQATPYITGFYGTIPDNNEVGEVGYMRASNDGDASIFFDSEL